MDNQDQEVVREPFEGPEEFASRSHANQLAEEEQRASGKHGENESDKNNKTSGDKIVCQRNQDANSQSEASSLADEDEVEFAKSFGIELKRTKKTSTNYDKLMNSKHLINKESSSTTTNTKSENNSFKIKTSITSDCIYHKGTFYQKGDIVALCDQDDGELYFAQVAGFLQDQYCEKSASLNWLVPIRPSSRDFFDPSAYKIGLVDPQLRKLDCMTFIRHCPHDYYFKKLFQMGDSTSPDDQLGERRAAAGRKRSTRGQAYIWTTMEPCSVPVIEKRLRRE